MKRRYFVHFDITQTCMTNGLLNPGQEGNDVLTRLAYLMRANPSVRQMLERITSGDLNKVIVGVGQEYEE